MKETKTQYRLPSQLSDFQLGMYQHLIQWKWKHLGKEAGEYRGNQYDAIIPPSLMQNGMPPHLYPEIADTLQSHRKLNPFRWHLHSNHMASSQVAAINLFLPILTSPHTSEILQGVPGAPTDFAQLDRDELDHGFCLEFWGGNFVAENSSSTNPQSSATGKGLLGDKSERAGTDADIAIAYLDKAGVKRLWLIEHKFLEAEFTTCGGARSKGRKACHSCKHSMESLIKDPSPCYYHEHCHYKYWEVTKRHQHEFARSENQECPFALGLNQLWRNQVLGWAIEDSQELPFKSVHFSVLRHPDNHALDQSLLAYQALIMSTARFSTLTSRELVEASEKGGGKELENWANWYRDLHKV